MEKRSNPRNDDDINLAYLVYVYCLFPRDHFGDFSVVAKINSTIYLLFFSGNTDLGQGRKILKPDWLAKRQKFDFSIKVNKLSEKAEIQLFQK